MFIYYKCSPEQEKFFNMRLCIKRLKPLIQKYGFTSKGKIKEYWIHNIQIISDMKQLLFYSHEDLDTNYEIHKFSDVFENGKNVILKPMDEIIILDREDLDFITSTEVIKLLTKNNLPLNLKYSCKALKILHNNIKSLGKNGKVKYTFKNEWDEWKG